jgi:hypothetical protein
MIKEPKYKLGDEVVRMYDNKEIKKEKIMCMRMGQDGNFYYGFEGGKGKYASTLDCNETEDEFFATREALLTFLANQKIK